MELDVSLLVQVLARGDPHVLEWLGPFIEPPDADMPPRLVGYIDYELEPRPFLLWAQDGRLTMEDLNLR